MLLKPWALTLLSSAWVTTGLPQAVSSAPIASKELPRFQPGCIAFTTACAGVVAAWAAGPKPVSMAAISATAVSNDTESREVTRRTAMDCSSFTGEYSCRLGDSDYGSPDLDSTHRPAPCRHPCDPPSA